MPRMPPREYDQQSGKLPDPEMTEKKLLFLQLGRQATARDRRHSPQPWCKMEALRRKYVDPTVE